MQGTLDWSGKIVLGELLSPLHATRVSHVREIIGKRTGSTSVKQEMIGDGITRMAVHVEHYRNYYSFSNTYAPNSDPPDSKPCWE